MPFTIQNGQNNGLSLRRSSTERPVSEIDITSRGYDSTYGRRPTLDDAQYEVQIAEYCTFE